MDLNNMIGKTLGAVKVISEKASESEKGVAEFVESIKKSASELMETKDKLEAKLAQFETEFKEMKVKITTYEAKLKKVGRMAAFAIGGLLLLQVITLVTVLLR